MPRGVNGRMHLAAGDSFSGFETKFLQLTSQRASAVNCRTDCGQGCPRNVVEHAADDIAAVCL